MPGHQGVYTRLYNVASFEWSAVVRRSQLSGRTRPVGEVAATQASHFDAGAAVFLGGLMWHRRWGSRPTLDGGSHGPALGAAPAGWSRIIRGNQGPCPPPHARLRLSGADGG